MKGFLIFVFITIISSISFLYTKSFIIIIFMIALLLFILKKYDIKYSLILIICFSFFQFYKVNKVIKLDEAKQISLDCKVYEVKEKYILVKSNNTNYLLYYDEEETIKKGYELHIEGTYDEIKEDLDIDVFEFKDYLNHKRVYCQIFADEITITNNEIKLSDSIIEKITHNLTDESLQMTKMLIFNDKNANIDNYNNLKDINAIHLFVVSGFHISFIFSLLGKLFNKNNIIGQIIAIIVCSFYVFLLGFTISATRALLTTIISIFFDKYINKLDSTSITGILFLFIEPLNIYNFSFIMTYVMTITILLTNNALKDKKKWVQVFVSSLICFISMIPIQLVLNYKINFISLISNFILSYVVLAIFVLCILGLFVSVFNGNIFGFIYKIFNDSIEYLSKLNSSIVFGHINIYLILLFYGIVILIIYTLEKNKTKNIGFAFSLVFIFLICLYNRNMFVFYQQVTFLNVYQGDCTIIQDSYNGKVMLIDTGGLKNYDIASKKIMPYLNYHGIKTIDVVVITHDDFDHNGALKQLQEQIKIKKIIVDPYTSEVNMGKINLVNLNTYFNDNFDDNDKSIVLYGNICDYNFLFTGDISFKIEEKIIANNEWLDVDVLKVSHHGSKSATSKDFINFIQPEFAIISVGENNKYNHPSPSVIDILNEFNVIIYRTDINGTIRFKGKIFDNCFIDSAK